MDVLKKMYKYWMVFAHFLGTVNGYLLLSVFYIFVIGIYALPSKLFRRRKEVRNTLWIERNNDKDPLTRAKFQF
jgi:hypothetical protein